MMVRQNDPSLTPDPTYALHMLRSLRSPTGGPSLRARVVAALVVLGALFATAPLLVLPLFQLLMGALNG